MVSCFCTILLQLSSGSVSLGNSVSIKLEIDPRHPKMLPECCLLGAEHGEYFHICKSTSFECISMVYIPCLLYCISHMKNPYVSCIYPLVFQLPRFISVHPIKVLLHLTQDRYNRIGHADKLQCLQYNVLLDSERDFAGSEVSWHYLSLCDCFFKSKVMLG